MELEVLDKPKHTRLLTPSGSHELSVIAVPGESVKSLIDRAIPVELRDYIVVYNKGAIITEPENFFVREEDDILLMVVPQGGGGGGKGLLGSVLAIAVMVAAPYAAPTVAGMMGVTSAAGIMAVTAGISMVGMMAISALVPPPKADTGGGFNTQATSPTYSIGGQSNASKKYGNVARIYGRHKYFPTLAANPLITNLGETSQIAALYDFGLGDIQVEKLKIGDADATTFDPEFHWHRDSLVKDTKFLSRQVGYDQFTYLLKSGKDIIIKTKPNSVGFDVDLNFNRGLAHVANSGNPESTSVSVLMEYRAVGSSTWIPIDASDIKGFSGVTGGGSLITTPVTTMAEAQHEDGVTYRYVASKSQIPGPVDEQASVQFPWGNSEKYQGSDGRHYFVVPTQWIKGYQDWNGLEASDGWSGRKFTTAAVVGTPTTGPGNALVFTGATFKPFVAVASKDGLTSGEYEVKVTLTSPDNTDNRYYKDVALTLIKSYKEGTVVNLDKKHTMLEMKIVASDKIQGTVQNLSGIAHSILRTTTDGVTFKNEPTRNPAWIALDILTGEGNPKPIPDNLIDWPSFIKLAKYCDDKKHYADFVVDYQTTIQDLLSQVLSLAHAAMRFSASGKYGVLIDEEQDIPRQLITPNNSWNFSGNRTFTDVPHGFLVTFINPEIDWQKDERIVYNDGYDATNATRFETLQTFGITDKDQAWRYGRYMMAQGIHRSETFTVSMDVENLVVQRGDLVNVAHDVPRIGGMACRIVAINGNEIEVDQILSQSTNGFSVRLDDGTVVSGMIKPGSSNTKYIINGAMPRISVDDIIVLGQVDRVVGKYIVQSINAGANLTAELLMVKYVPEVYRSDTESIPPWNPEMSQDLINSTNLAIDSIVAKQETKYIDRLPFADIRLDWSVLGFGYSKGEVYMTAPGRPPEKLGETDGMSFNYLIDLIKRTDLVGKDLSFEIIPITAGGIVGRPGSTTITPNPDRTKPNPVLGFAVNVQSETVNCMWSKPPEPDVVEYQLRYSPDVTPSAYWDGAQHLATVPYTSTQVAAGARTGTYFIRAYDSSGNVSDVVSQRTTVQELPNVEQVTDIDDRIGGWKGIKNNLVVRGVQRDRMMSEWNKLSQVVALDEKGAGLGDLMSAGNWGSVAPVSYYTFDKPVDLNGIYEVRVSSMIECHGEDEYGNTVSSDLWDAWLEYRVTSDLSFISDWKKLSDVVDMAGHNTNTWSEWRHIAVGDVTGKLIQFRIQVRSYDPNVKVVVTDGSVIIDAADRMWSVQNFQVGARLTRINFDPPFMFDDVAVAVSVEGTDLHLIPNITNKTRTGCDIELLEASTRNLSAGRIDVIARGQGRERSKPI